DVLKSGSGPRIFWMFLIQTELYGETIRSVFPFAVVAIAVLAGLLLRQGRVREAISANRTLIKSIALYSTPCFLFFWLLGFYYSRLTWSLIPGLALLIAIAMQSLDKALNDEHKRALRAASVAVTLLYAT